MIDEISFEGDIEFDGDDPMIRIKTGTIDSLQLNIKQISDNERVALSLVGAIVRFHAKQIGPAENLGDPAVPKTINKLCNIINPVNGIAAVPLGAGNTDTPGMYDCYVEIQKGGDIIFSKFTFKMNIWDD